METIDLTCIVCPLGCGIKVEKNGNQILSITGNKCKRGYDYSYEEVTYPKRTLTTTVKTENGLMLPVKSNKALPKEKILLCMNVINGIKVKTPVNIGDIIVKNILDTGVDIVASKNINGG